MLDSFRRAAARAGRDASHDTSAVDLPGPARRPQAPPNKQNPGCCSTKSWQTMPTARRSCPRSSISTPPCTACTRIDWTVARNDGWPRLQGPFAIVGLLKNKHLSRRSADRRSCLSATLSAGQRLSLLSRRHCRRAAGTVGQPWKVHSAIWSRRREQPTTTDQFLRGAEYLSLDIVKAWAGRLLLGTFGLATVQLR